MLNPLKAVPEVCTIFCATANPVDVLVAATDGGRGIISVTDGLRLVTKASCQLAYRDHH